MTTLAFADGADGYYQYESADGSIPDWAKGLTQCQVLVVVADPKDAIRAEIARLLASAGVNEAQAWLIDSGMASMIALASTQGLTEPELYAVNPGYKQVKDVADQIKALRDQL